jgi:hypothetical protein
LLLVTATTLRLHPTGWKSGPHRQSSTWWRNAEVLVRSGSEDPTSTSGSTTSSTHVPMVRCARTPP